MLVIARVHEQVFIDHLLWAPPRASLDTVAGNGHPVPVLEGLMGCFGSEAKNTSHLLAGTGYPGRSRAGLQITGQGRKSPVAAVAREGSLEEMLTRLFFKSFFLFF